MYVCIFVHVYVWNCICMCECVCNVFMYMCRYNIREINALQRKFVAVFCRQNCIDVVGVSASPK